MCRKMSKGKEFGMEICRLPMCFQIVGRKYLLYGTWNVEAKFIAALYKVINRRNQRYINRFSKIYK